MSSIKIMPKNKTFCEANNKTTAPNKKPIRYHRRKHYQHNQNSQNYIQQHQHLHHHNNQQQQEQQDQIHKNNQQEQKYQYHNNSYISSSSSISSSSESSSLSSSSTSISSNNSNNLSVLVNNLYNNKHHRGSYPLKDDYMQLSPLKSIVTTNLKCNNNNNISGNGNEKKNSEVNCNVEGMNNFNLKTTQPQIISTPTSPASYSLDFLHYVGIQISAGRNISGHKIIEQVPTSPLNKSNNSNVTTTQVSNSKSNMTTSKEDSHLDATMSIKSANHNQQPQQSHQQQQHVNNHPHHMGYYHHEHIPYYHNVGGSGNANVNCTPINFHNHCNQNNRYQSNQQNQYHHNNNYHMYNRNHSNQKSHQNRNWSGNNHNNNNNTNHNWTTNRNIPSSLNNEINANKGIAQQNLKIQNNTNKNNKNGGYHQITQLTNNRKTSSNGSLNNLSNKSLNSRPSSLNSRSPTPSPKSDSPPIKSTSQPELVEEHEVVKNQNAPIEQSRTTIPVTYKSVATSTTDINLNKPPPVIPNNCFSVPPPQPPSSAGTFKHHQFPQPINSSVSPTGYDSDSSLTPTTYFIGPPSPIPGHHIIDLSPYHHIPVDDKLIAYYAFYGSQQNLTTNWSALNYNTLILNNTASTVVTNNQPTSAYSSNSSDTGCVQHIPDDTSEDGSSCKKKHLTSTSQAVPTIPIQPSQTHIAKFRTNNINSKKQNTAIFGAKHSFEPTYTPPDRFLAKSHLVETKNPKTPLLLGGIWDPLSQDIWDRFIAAQQTEATFKKKMLLWRYLFLCVKVSFTFNIIFNFFAFLK